jgi:hypothetical protein
MILPRSIRFIDDPVGREARVECREVICISPILPAGKDVYRPAG